MESSWRFQQMNKGEPFSPSSLQGWSSYQEGKVLKHSIRKPGPHEIRLKRPKRILSRLAPERSRTTSTSDKRHHELKGLTNDQARAAIEKPAISTDGNFAALPLPIARPPLT
ncbi:MAG: hypothetical protein H6569_01620 [Lewinellaceae bacterium]|nr:hypothetical protein [Lewinellaceae bacterium]